MKASLLRIVNQISMKRVKYTAKFKNIVVWIVTVVLSIVLVLAANRFFSRDLDLFSQTESTVKAKVVSLGETYIDEYYAGALYVSGVQLFDAEILNGPEKGTIVTAQQDRDNFSGMNDRVVEEGDIVILYSLEGLNQYADWTFGSYARFDAILVLGIIFVIILVGFGLWKGLSTIVSLAFTCLAVFCVFIPAILNGANIYLMTVVICIYTIVMTLLLTNGISHKSLTTIVGCIFGVAVAAILSVVMDNILQLTGIIDEHSVYLQSLSNGNELSLTALIFAMIVIGAMGAVMDVAMDISSSLYEVYNHAPHISFNELFMSGIRIGRDIMGTMANTLVLAYIGSSLCSVLLYFTYSSSLLELLNRESIVVELMQSLIGSLSILLTIPITSLVCCVYYKESIRPL